MMVLAMLLFVAPARVVAQNGITVALGKSAELSAEQKLFLKGIELYKASKGGLSYSINDAGPVSDAVGTSAAVVGWGTSDIDPVASSLQSQKVIGIIAHSVTKRVMYLGSYVFGFGYSEELTYKEYASFAGKKLSANRICVVQSVSPLQEVRTNSFVEQSKSLGNTVVFQEKVAATEVGPLLSRAVNEKCDILFAAIDQSELSVFFTALKGSLYKGKVLLGDLDPFSQENAKGIGNPLYGISPWATDDALMRLSSDALGRTVTPKELGDIALGYDLMGCLNATQGEFSADTLKYSFLASPCEGLTGITRFSGQRISQRRKRVINISSTPPALAE